MNIYHEWLRDLILDQMLSEKNIEISAGSSAKKATNRPLVECWII